MYFYDYFLPTGSVLPKFWLTATFKLLLNTWKEFKFLYVSRHSEVHVVDSKPKMYWNY